MAQSSAADVLPKPGKRTYNPGVRIGNWNEDISAEEEKLKDLLERRDKGDLTVHKVMNATKNIMKPVSLSISADGLVHFGDVIQIRSAEAPKECVLGAFIDETQVLITQRLSGPCSAVACVTTEPVVRNTFVIESTDGRTGALTYAEPFCLRTVEENLYLSCEPHGKMTRKSRIPEITLTPERTFACQWRAIFFDPEYRMEMEGKGVPANTKLMIKQLKSNHDIACMHEHSVRTFFGFDYEIGLKTWLDSHKFEMPCNHWILSTRSSESMTA